MPNLAEIKSPGIGLDVRKVVISRFFPRKGNAATAE